jgi:hypothetical protein
MKTPRKTLLAITMIAGLGVTAAAVAGPGGGHGRMMGYGPEDCPMMRGGHKWGGGPEQRAAMMRERQAERMELLEARLKLQPEQQAAWQAFVAARTAHHDAMWQGRRAMRDRATTAPAHFEQRIQGMEQRLASMKTTAQAANDLYATLDAEQKQVMDRFFTERPRRGMMRGGPAATLEQAAEAAE